MDEAIDERTKIVLGSEGIADWEYAAALAWYRTTFNLRWRMAHPDNNPGSDQREAILLAAYFKHAMHKLGDCGEAASEDVVQFACGCKIVDRRLMYRLTCLSHKIGASSQQPQQEGSDATLARTPQDVIARNASKSQDCEQSNAAEPTPIRSEAEKGSAPKYIIFCSLCHKEQPNECKCVMHYTNCADQNLALAHSSYLDHPLNLVEGITATNSSAPTAVETLTAELKEVREEKNDWKRLHELGKENGLRRIGELQLDGEYWKNEAFLCAKTIEALRATIATLTKERDEARQSNAKSCNRQEDK
jgi:hypothetical protein